MKLVENGKAITRRDLAIRLEKVQRALGAQAQRADAAERENEELRKRIAQLRAGAVAGARAIIEDQIERAGQDG